MRAQSPQLKGESDSGKSVAEELACRMCQGPDRADGMLVCEGRNLGFHMDCLKPSLEKVLSGDLICDDFPSSSTTKVTLSRKLSYDAAALNNVDPR
ncbi:hypothetical protein WJX77_001166 [Trebouxia sp. C0004]